MTHMVNRAWLAAPLLALLVAGCATPTAGSGQTAEVSITPGACEVATDLRAVTTTFNVRNITAKGGTFVITEDEGTKEVGRVDVEPGSMKALTVHLDAEDVYQTACADTRGPDIHPKA